MFSGEAGEHLEPRDVVMKNKEGKIVKFKNGTTEDKA
jgi:hypothetical protein